jgi:hypothetical protein
VFKIEIKLSGQFGSAGGDGDPPAGAARVGGRHRPHVQGLSLSLSLILYIYIYIYIYISFDIMHIMPHVPSTSREDQSLSPSPSLVLPSHTYSTFPLPNTLPLPHIHINSSSSTTRTTGSQPVRPCVIRTSRNCGSRYEVYVIYIYIYIRDPSAHVPKGAKIAGCTTYIIYITGQEGQVRGEREKDRDTKI